MSTIGGFQKEPISYKSCPMCPTPPALIPSSLSLDVSSSGRRSSLDRGGAWDTQLCGQGLCLLVVAWAICLLHPLCQVSTCSQLSGVHLGWGKGLSRAAPIPGNALKRGLTGSQEPGVRGQGSVRGLLSPRLIGESQGDIQMHAFPGALGTLANLGHPAPSLGL